MKPELAIGVDLDGKVHFRFRPAGEPLIDFSRYEGILLRMTHESVGVYTDEEVGVQQNGEQDITLTLKPEAVATFDTRIQMDSGVELVLVSMTDTIVIPFDGLSESLDVPCSWARIDETNARDMLFNAATTFGYGD